MDEQLPLFVEPARKPTWYNLERDEQYALLLLMLNHDQYYILHPRLQWVIPGLKEKGLVRDNLFVKDALDITSYAEKLFSDWNQYLLNTGQMFIEYRGTIKGW